MRLAYLAHHFAGFDSWKDVLDRLSAVQLDPGNVVAPNHALVFGTRTEFDEDVLRNAYEKTEVFEVYAKGRCVLPVRLAPLFGLLIAARRRSLERDIQQHADQVGQIFAAIESSGSVTAGELQSGKIGGVEKWGPKHLHTQLLYVLWQAGEIIVCARNGREVRYCKAPAGMWRSGETKETKTEIDRLERWQRYLDSAGVVERSDPFLGFERAKAAERKKALAELLERGCAVAASLLDQSLIMSRNFLSRAETTQEFGARFVAPLDNAIWNRSLIEKLYGFRYRWEIYVPADRRVCGPYAMPLVSERGFSGPVDVTFERSSRTLFVRPQKKPIWDNPVPLGRELDQAATRLAKAIGAERIRFA